MPGRIRAGNMCRLHDNFMLWSLRESNSVRMARRIVAIRHVVSTFPQHFYLSFLVIVFLYSIQRHKTLGDLHIRLLQREDNHNGHKTISVLFYYIAFSFLFMKLSLGVELHHISYCYCVYEDRPFVDCRRILKEVEQSRSLFRDQAD